MPLLDPGGLSSVRKRGAQALELLLGSGVQAGGLADLALQVGELLLAIVDGLLQVTHGRAQLLLLLLQRAQFDTGIGGSLLGLLTDAGRRLLGLLASTELDALGFAPGRIEGVVRLLLLALDLADNLLARRLELLVTLVVELLLVTMQHIEPGLHLTLGALPSLDPTEHLAGLHEACELGGKFFGAAEDVFAHEKFLSVLRMNMVTTIAVVPSPAVTLGRMSAGISVRWSMRNEV